jgi:hypothetical protein
MEFDLRLFTATFAPMNTNDPIIAGLMSFLLWTALSACCFPLATGVAWYIARNSPAFYATRLVLMFLLLIVWLFLPAALARAYAGNHADPQDAYRRARWEAKGYGSFCGMNTIWAWGLVSALRRPKPRTNQAQTC